MQNLRILRKCTSVSFQLPSPGPREGQRGAIDLARGKGGAVEGRKEDGEDDRGGELGRFLFQETPNDHDCF